MYLDKYQEWQNKVTPREREQLANLSEDQIKEFFLEDLTFGTGGIRGIMGLGSSRINKYTLSKVTHGYANYLLKKYSSKNNITIVISYDNRNHSQSFALETALVLSSYNIKVLMFEKLAPTPLLSFAVRYYNAQGGIMITASHNPKEYNGYKVYNETGSQLNLVESNDLINEINQLNTWFFTDKSKKELVKFVYNEVVNIYFDKLKKVKINDENNYVKILYSPLHGTGSSIGVKALELRGFNVVPYWDHLVNDPNFSKTVSSNPEDESLYELLINSANAQNCDIVLTNDPDADRFGVAVKHQNEFKLLNGNQVASLILYYILEHGTHKLDQMVYTTVVSTPLLETISNYYQQNLTYTLTGFKFIGEKLETNQNKYEFIFGAEESNGILINDFVRDKDGIQAITIIAEMANYYMRQKMTLIDALEVIYQKFGYYYEQTISISLKGLEGSNKIKSIMENFIKEDFNLPNTSIREKINFNESYQTKFGSLPSSNVVKYIYDNQSWICIRPSGTEPKIKFYIGVVSNSIINAQKEIDQIINLLSSRVESF